MSDKPPIKSGITPTPYQLTDNLLYINLDAKTVGRLTLEQREFYQKNSTNRPLYGTSPKPLTFDPSNPFPWGLPAKAGDGVPLQESMPWENDPYSQYEEGTTKVLYGLVLYRAKGKGGFCTDGTPQEVYHSDGLAMCVSVDGISWLQIGLWLNADILAPGVGFSGGNIFLDREGKVTSPGGAIVSCTANGTDPTNKAAGESLGNCCAILECPKGIWDEPKWKYSAWNHLSGWDGRLIWRDEIKKFVIVYNGGGSSTMGFLVGDSPDRMGMAGKYTAQDYPEAAIECPNLIQLIDQVTGELRDCLIVSRQVGGPQTGACRNEWIEGSVGTFDGNTFINDPTIPTKRFSYGCDQYANAAEDPLQRDGTGGTTIGAPSVPMRYFAGNWGYSEDPMPEFGFRFGVWPASELVLRNGQLMELPPPYFYRDFSGMKSFILREPATEQTPIVAKQGKFCRIRITTLSNDGTGMIKIMFGSSQFVSFLLNSTTKNIIFDRSNCGKLYIPQDGPPPAFMSSNNPHEFFIYYDNGRLMFHNVTDGNTIGNIVAPTDPDDTITGITFTGSLWSQGSVIQIGE